MCRETYSRGYLSAEIVPLELREHRLLGSNGVIFLIYLYLPEKSSLVDAYTLSFQNCLTPPKPLNTECGINVDMKLVVVMMDSLWHALWGHVLGAGLWECSKTRPWNDCPFPGGACLFLQTGFPCSALSLVTGRSTFLFLLSRHLLCLF